MFKNKVHHRQVKDSSPGFIIYEIICFLRRLKSYLRSVPSQEKDLEFFTVSYDILIKYVPPQDEDLEFITMEILRNTQLITLSDDKMPSTSPRKSNTYTQGTTSSFCSPYPIPDNSPYTTSNSNTSLATPPSL